MTIESAIDAARASLLPLLRDTATITHTPLVFSGGTQHKGTPVVVENVPCNVQRTMGAAQTAVADSLSVVNPALLRFAAGAVIEAGDVITVGDATFHAVVQLSGTITLTYQVLCREIIG